MNAAMNTTLKISIVFIIAAALTAAYIYFGNITIVGVAKNGAEHKITQSAAGEVILNELMSSNKGFINDGRGKSSDWIELYNTADNEISMQGYALTDNADELTKWPFPDVVIAPHAYLVIFLAGDIASDVQSGVIHCSFKLNSSGDSLMLVDPLQQIADSVEIPKLQPNVSYGRMNGQWQKISSPTPGYENSDAGFLEFMQEKNNG